jgi:hypothetical protein
MLWDVFCQVIDNHGDLGVCWRLATQLAARGQRVRLWVDDGRALAWMAPGALEGPLARHSGAAVDAAVSRGCATRSHGAAAARRRVDRGLRL